jgi:hypothetical protein
MRRESFRAGCEGPIQCDIRSGAPRRGGGRERISEEGPPRSPAHVGQDSGRRCDRSAARACPRISAAVRAATAHAFLTADIDSMLAEIERGYSGPEAE